MTAEKIINYLGLKPLEKEGGLFTDAWRSDEILTPERLPERYTTDHPVYSNIYYLMTSKPDSFSAIHKLKSDETWHFYKGDPLELFLLYPDGKSETVIMGSDILNGQKVQFTVPRGVWQGARLLSGGNYALAGMSVAPGYLQEDFTLGKREELSTCYPEKAKLIKVLTRE